MATIKNKYYFSSRKALDANVEKKIIEYLESLPIGSVCCSSELKELIFGEVPKRRMQMFERSCKTLMLSHGFIYIDKPYTIEYKRQRCYQKVSKE